MGVNNEAVNTMNANGSFDLNEAPFWLLVLKRWYVVLAMVALGFGFVFMNHALSEPEYESKAYVRIGSLPGTQANYLESQKSLITRLAVTYNVGSRRSGAAYVSAVHNVIIKGGSEDVIAISTRGTDPAEAYELLRSIVSNILEDHAQRESVVRKEFLAHEKMLSKHIAAINTHLESVPGNEQAIYDGEDALLSLVGMKRMEVISELTTAVNYHSRLKSWLENEDIWKTTVIRETGVADAPADRSAKKDYLAAFLLAIFASIIVIAMLEYRATFGRLWSK